MKRQARRQLLLYQDAGEIRVDEMAIPIESGLMNLAEHLRLYPGGRTRQSWNQGLGNPQGLEQLAQLVAGLRREAAADNAGVLQFVILSGSGE
jgi:hypothetical protein